MDKMVRTILNNYLVPTVAAGSLLLATTMIGTSFYFMMDRPAKPVVNVSSNDEPKNTNIVPLKYPASKSDCQIQYGSTNECVPFKDNIEGTVYLPILSGQLAGLERIDIPPTTTSSSTNTQSTNNQSTQHGSVTSIIPYFIPYGSSTTIIHDRAPLPAPPTTPATKPPVYDTGRTPPVIDKPYISPTPAPTHTPSTTPSTSGSSTPKYGGMGSTGGQGSRFSGSSGMSGGGVGG